MSAYIIRRIIIGLIIVILVSLIVFFIVRLLPGDPLVIYMSSSTSMTSMTEEQLQILRHQYGLDQPVFVQYVNWVKGIFHGNLGMSLNYHQDVTELLAQRFPITLHLGIISFILSSVLGVTFGMLAAIRRGTWIDTLVTILSYVGITMPAFWLGLLLMYALGLKLNLLPMAGYTSPTTDFWLNTRQIIMPVICLSLGGLASTARQMRSSVLEIARQDYIRTAWAKGLKERVIVLRHMLKNSISPVITLLGLYVGMIFGGSVLVETVFAIPGIGRLLVTSMLARDYVVIQSGTLVIATIIVMTNLVVDIAYGWFDPRIRYS
jgi:peptide/nickel transport system permease protein